MGNILNKVKNIYKNFRIVKQPPEDPKSIYAVARGKVYPGDVVKVSIDGILEKTEGKGVGVVEDIVHDNVIKLLPYRPPITIKPLPYRHPNKMEVEYE